jgi:hypothetical protein
VGNAAPQWVRLVKVTLRPECLAHELPDGSIELEIGPNLIATRWCNPSYVDRDSAGPALMTVAFPHPIEQLVAKVFPRAKRQRRVVPLDKLIERRTAWCHNDVFRPKDFACSLLASSGKHEHR